MPTAVRDPTSIRDRASPLVIGRVTGKVIAVAFDMKAGGAEDGRELKA